MKILFIADPKISVPPKYYGGAERIVALYADEFSRLGHVVDLMAGPKSRAFSGRVYIHRDPSSACISRAYRKIWFQFYSVLAASRCDVVYNHGRLDYLEVLLALRKPLLTAFHNPISQAQIDFAERRIQSDVAFHFVSSSQASAARISSPSYIIPNPIDVRRYASGGGEGGYLAFLGRMTFNKGVDIAIAVALRTGRKLVIAGNISNEEGGDRYFRDCVMPFIDDDQICWIGTVNDEQKQQLLSQASALLFPIRWDEPFGIVMTEALACGCPVIATRRASTPDVIDHGVTGWLCDPEEPSVEAFVEAVTRVPELNRQACRKAVEKRFDVRVVAPRILDVLQRLSLRQSIA